MFGIIDRDRNGYISFRELLYAVLLFSKGIVYITTVISMFMKLISWYLAMIYHDSNLIFHQLTPRELAPPICKSLFLQPISFLLTTGPITSGKSNGWSCVSDHVSMCPSRHIAVISQKPPVGIFHLGHDNGPWSGNDTHIFKMLILSGIIHPQTKMCVVKIFPHVIS